MSQACTTSTNKVLTAAWALVLVACGGAETPTIWLDDASNYAFSGEINAETMDIAPQQHLDVDWGDLTLDIRGRNTDPSTDIGELALVSFYMPEADLMQALANNDLMQSDIRDYRIFENLEGVTTASSSAFSVVGNPFDKTLLTESETSTWTLVAMRGAGSEAEVASLAVLTPTEGETNSSVALDNASATLDFTADLQSAVPVVATSGTAYTLDWSEITQDSTGHEYASNTFDRLTVAHILNDDIDELEAQFVQLLELADSLYRLDIYGRDSLSLDELEDQDGTPFTGFTTDGTWLIALECPACLSPAPLVLTAVDVQ